MFWVILNEIIVGGDINIVFDILISFPVPDIEKNTLSNFVNGQRTWV